MKNEIEKHWAIKNPKEAIKGITKVWREAADVVTLATARTRLLLRRLEKPETYEIDEGLSQAIDNVDCSALARNIKSSAKKAISMVLNVYPELDVDITIDEATNGKLEVAWHASDGSVRWVFWPSEIAWPGVNVRVYTSPREDPARIKVTQIFTAQDLLEHFHQEWKTLQ